MGKTLASSLSLTHPHTLIPLQERKNNFSGKLGERPWTAGFSPEGSACPGGWYLQRGKLPGRPPLALHQGGLCGPACWEEGVALGMQCGPSSHQRATGCHLSSVLSISIRSKLRRGAGVVIQWAPLPRPSTLEAYAHFSAPLSSMWQVQPSSTAGLLLASLLPCVFLFQAPLSTKRW